MQISAVIKINLFKIILVTGLAISACAEVTPQLVTPSPLIGEPSVEVIEITPIPTNTPTVTYVKPTLIETVSGTAVPSIIIEQPTPEITLQVDPGLQNRKFPPALILIDKPGSASRLASPILVQANVYPGEGGLVSVQLIGENGRLMADQLLKMIQPDSGWVQLVTEIKFEITSAGESALIVISTRDGYGRRIAQTAVPVLLLQIGKSENELPGFLKQPFVIESPVTGGLIKNGTLRVSGFAHPFNSNPIIIELVTQTGGIMESKVVVLPKIAQDQEYAAFVAEIPYEVFRRTPVRLTIRQRSESLPGIDIALSSQILYLDP
ncbi:MAG: hypothetical protein FD147_280 [Chloroflexi bacterium]|nr:MAG: hypothetical protein FD147_280 [Chloroflexota bacterium]